ncbi:MAG: hypothetical protein EXS05_11030 [Planctomycetaceae bacterium]|nr:hypothetical protein [Planctomycetaceae bacterium]
MFRMIRGLQVAAWATVLMTTSLGSTARADDPLPTTDDDPPAKAAPDRKPRVEQKPTSPEDEKLLEGLDPTGNPLETEIEKLERAIAGMRKASEKIEADDTSSKTLEVQKQVIQDLDDLLKLLRQQQQAQQSKSQQQKKQNQKKKDQQQKDRQKLPKQKLDPQNSGKPQEQAGQQPAERNDSDRSRDAQERAEAAKQALAEEARRQQLFKDVWGHLPPHLRDAVLSSFNDKYLPKYEDLVKRYYEALAEKNRKQSAK